MHGNREVRITSTGKLRDGATLFQRLDGARRRQERESRLARFNRACGAVALGTGCALALIVALSDAAL